MTTGSVPQEPRDGFTIGEPEVAATFRARGPTKYKAIWDAAESLNGDEALPVTFPNRMDAVLFASRAREAQLRGFRVSRRGDVVYVMREARDD